MWLLPKCVALAVGCSLVPTCGGGNWTCLIPTCVAMAVGCDWHPHHWRWQLDLVEALLSGGVSWMCLVPRCVTVAVSMCLVPTRVWLWQLDVVCSLVCDGGSWICLVSTRAAVVVGNGWCSRVWRWQLILFDA